MNQQQRDLSGRRFDRRIAAGDQLSDPLKEGRHRADQVYRMMNMTQVYTGSDIYAALL